MNATRREDDWPFARPDLNKQGMEEWRKLGSLAEFPGTLYLADSRDGCAAYPCQAVQPEEVAELEPCLSEEAAAAGACRYSQEGEHWHACCGDCKAEPQARTVTACMLVCAGFGYATEATEAFLAEARSGGADVRFSQPVTALHSDNGRVTGAMVCPAAGLHCLGFVQGPPTI